MMYDLGTLDLAACFAAVILAAFGGAALFRTIQKFTTSRRGGRRGPG